MPEVAKAEVFGARPEQLFVEIWPKRLAQPGLDFRPIVLMAAALLALPAMYAAWFRIRRDPAAS